MTKRLLFAFILGVILGVVGTLTLRPSRRSRFVVAEGDVIMTVALDTYTGQTCMTNPKIKTTGLPFCGDLK